MASFDDIKKQLNIGSKLLQKREQRSTTRSVEEVRELEKISNALKGKEEFLKEIDKISKQIADYSNEYDKAISDRMSSLSELVEMKSQLSKQLPNIERQLSASRSRLRSMSPAHQQNVQNVFMRDVASAIGQRTVTHNIAQMQQSSAMLPGAVQASERFSSTELERRIERKRAMMEIQGERALKTAGNIEGREGVFASQMGQHERLQGEIAEAQAALGIQRKQGTDLRSRFFKAQDFGARLTNERKMDEARTQGLGTDPSKAAADLKSIGDEYIATLSKFNKAMSESSEEAEDLGKKLNDLQDDYKRHETVLQAANASGGGGLMGRWSQGQGSIIGDIGRVVQAGGQVYREAAVTSELARTQAQIGIARAGNERIEDIRGAAGGDARSLHRVMTGLYSRQRREGEDMGDAAQTALGVEFAGKIGQSVDKLGSGIMGGIGNAVKDAVGSAFSPGSGGMLGSVAKLGLKGTVGAVTGGLSAAAGDVTSTAAMGIDLSKDITKTQTMLQRFNQIGDLADEINKPTYRQMQSGIDYSKGMRQAARGGGSRINQLMGAFAPGGDTLEGLTGRFMSVDDVVGGFGAGVRGLGAQFGGMSDIRQGAGMVNAGRFESMGQFMQARGQMAGAGGGADDLETIMANAVAAGMDNSKNIMEMVGATTSLSNRSAQIGAVSYGGAAAVLGGATRAVSGIEDRNVRMRAAASGMQAAAADMSDVGLDFASMQAFQQVREKFPGADFTEVQAIQRLSPDQISQLEKDPSYAERLGLKSLVKGSKENVKHIRDIQVGKALWKRAGLSDPKMTSSIQEKLKRPAGKRLLSDEERQFALRLGLITGTSGEAHLGALGAEFEEEKGTRPDEAGGMPKKKSALKMGPRDPFDVATDMDYSRQRGKGAELGGKGAESAQKREDAGSKWMAAADKLLESANRLGAIDISNADKAISKIGGYEAIAKASKVSADAIKESGANFATALKEATESMKLPENFNQEVAKLGGAATALGNSASKLDGSTAALNESVNKFDSSIKNAIRSLKAL